MPKDSALIDDDMIDSLDRDGAICLRGAFSQAWIDVASEGIRRNIESPTAMFQSFAPEGRGAFYSDLWSRRQIPQLDTFALESPAAAIAARCLRTSTVRLLQDTWFLKGPGTQQRTPWHHDNMVLGPFCSIWVALDPIPRADALEFVRGSHRLNQLFMPATFFEKDQMAKDLPAVEEFYARYHGQFDIAASERFSPVPDVDGHREDYDILGWEMDAGDCLVFHARTLHGAPGNNLPHDSRRMVTRWIDDTAVLAPHGRGVIDRLTTGGFAVDLAVGEPIRGDLFPVISPFA
jgi:ectoine hydroxylase-related dioxygenase (phytanoyl-CoA dioxygenase family)